MLIGLVWFDCFVEESVLCFIQVESWDDGLIYSMFVAFEIGCLCWTRCFTMFVRCALKEERRTMSILLFFLSFDSI